MRDLLLASVDRRLQSIYRTFLRAHPLNSATHDRRIASLEATRNDILAVLRSYDWQWLAAWLSLDRIGETAETCVRRLANFAFSIRGLRFRFTYHCNITCQHCHNNSGPRLKSRRIPRETMLAIIAEMPQAGIGHFNVSGGEPFLYLDDVTALIAAGRAAGLRGISTYTNGFWASTDERANKIIERLAQVGFMQGQDDHMLVSAGVYHQEFIAFDRILTLARNFYARFGRRVIIDFELPPQAGSLANDVRNQIGAAGLTEQVKLLFRRVMPHGRGKDIAGIAMKTVDGPCNIIDEIVFDADGSVRPCWGLNYENQGVVIERSGPCHLKDLVKRMQNDPILQFLATHPMSDIFTHVTTAQKSEGYSGPCDLCQHAVGELRDKEPLQATLIRQQNFYPFWFTLSPTQEVQFLWGQELKMD